MPLNFPPLTQIVEEIRGDVAGRLDGADTLTPRSPIDVLVRLLAYAHHTCHGAVLWLARQIFWDTIEAEMLDRVAGLWIGPRLAATAATGTVTVTGIAGAIVPAEWRFRRADGAEYLVTASTLIGAGGTAAVPVMAVAAGVAGNAVAPTPLQLISPIAGASSNAVVAGGGLTGGADEESDDSYRARWRQRVQEPPRGGAARDYVYWARQFPGVSDAWCFPGENGAGTVVVRFMMHDVYSDGLPQEADRLALLAYLQQRRPATAALSIGVPVGVPRSYSIAVTPDRPDVRAAIEAELRDLIRREGAPGGTLRISREREAISRAAGETDHTLIAPLSDRDYASTEVPVFGGIAWSG